MKKLLLFVSISLMSLIFPLTILHAEPEAVKEECSLSHLEKCKDGIYPDYKVFAKKSEVFFGKLGHKYVPYLYKGRLLEQFFSVFETYIGVKKMGNFYYLDSFRRHSAFEKGIAAYTEKGQMVGAGIFYRPCVDPKFKGDCTVHARLAIYVKSIPQKEEIITNMKAWADGMIQSEAFKSSNIHLEQVKVYPVP